MDETHTVCPYCGGDILLSEALETQLQARYDAAHQARIDASIVDARRKAEAERDAISGTLQRQLVEPSQKTSETESQLIELRRNALQQKASEKRAIDKARIETEERLRKETEAQLKARISEVEKSVHTAAALEHQRLEALLNDERARLAIAQKAELTRREKTAELEARAREIDLELARRIDAKKTEWEQGLRQTLSVEQELKVKEKQIDDMKKVIDDLKRKSEQGSQEMQGEVLEIDIQSALERRFPHDQIRPVPKGMSGADLIEDVRDGSGHTCGSLIWEVKNTKHWQAGWLDKLKADQRDADATIAMLVTMALPEGVRGFARLNGVWVTDLAYYPMLAVALREQLQQVAFARAAGRCKREKIEMLYQYLESDEFRHRVEAIVDAFSSLPKQLDKERRAMTRHWAEREKQPEQVILSTTDMYGSLQGIFGKTLPAIQALELAELGLLESNS